MRAYILTETERRLLESYLETRAKTSNLIVLFHRIRKNLLKLKEDIDLLSRALTRAPTKEKKKRRQAREQEKKELTWHELIYGTNKMMIRSRAH